MVTLSAAKLAVAVGGVALSLTAGVGVAFADPADSAVNTTCSYSQVVAALNAQSPAAANEFNASRAAQAWVRTFLASPPDQRQQMAQQAQSIPGVQQYVGLVDQIANTCNNY
ncbi:MAG: hemophore-related protein [Mycolicibacterium sp.]|nr:hemophore-related protein [Mycolicibacterium sp.]